MTLTNIKTNKDYEDYKERVYSFFKKENINSLTTHTNEQEPYFSRSPCDCCSRPLGGDKYDCNGYCAELSTIKGPFSICADCYHFSAYGQLNDTTMSTIKNT